jgi:hypothetical protein
MSTDYHIYWNFGQPYLKIKILGENKNICVHYKVTLRTFVSTLDFAMLIVLQLGSDGQLI